MITIRGAFCVLLCAWFAVGGALGSDPGFSAVPVIDSGCPVTSGGATIDLQSPRLSGGTLGDIGRGGRGNVPAPTAWESALERLSFYGDLRLRHETDTELVGAPSRNRERLRFRFGADYTLHDEVSIGARIATGDRRDPNSPHQTLGNGFDRFEVALDRLFVTCRPEEVPGLWVTAGKFAHPFWTNPIYPELVWDADVQPEGIAAGYRFEDLGFLERFDVVAGQYILLEQRMAADARAFVAQAAARGRLGESWRPSLAVGYYRYSDLTPGDSQTLANENVGNAVVGTGTDADFQSRFEILNPIASLTYEGWEVPVTVGGEFIRNVRADIAGDQGWAVGTSVGSAKQSGDWRGYYQWQVVEQDAVLSLFAQDDFLLRTRHRSHVLGANHQRTDTVGLHLWGLVSARERPLPGAPISGGREQWRLRFDVNIRF